jgi:sensor histidine kinase YesM
MLLLTVKLKFLKWLIHTFVENAVKHGINHLENKGEIQIKIENNKSDYIIYVCDNGIGREKAKELSVYSTGKGLGILEQILDLYYSLMKVRITYEIKDIFDDTDKLRGTEVCIKIPIKG